MRDTVFLTRHRHDDKQFVIVTMTKTGRRMSEARDLGTVVAAIATTALADLGEAATDDLAQLHQALGDADATALPDLLAATHQHLPDHPDLAAQVDAVT